MIEKNTLHGEIVHKYVEFEIHKLNDILKKAGCKRAKALYRHEEKPNTCAFSCLTEDNTTTFDTTLSSVLKIKILNISWVFDDRVGIVFDSYPDCGIKGEKLSIYQERGYKDRDDYLQQLADDYGVDACMVFSAADLLGPNEDFDGLISSIEDLT